MGFVNPITLMNNKFEFTYASLIRSEENSRKALGTVRYFTFILSVVTRTFFVIAALCSNGVCFVFRQATTSCEWDGCKSAIALASSADGNGLVRQTRAPFA
jgi:hypothetical protein